VRYQPGLHDARCTACHGKGFVTRQVQLSELQELLGEDQ
jgi:hypothetical protein